MQFGISMFPTDETVNLIDLGRMVEEVGFDTFFVPEHTHIPTSRQSPWPGGGELPREYARILDPFVALGAVAAATSRLLIGIGVCLVIERDPIVLAKEVASLDFVSGGRFLFGIGGGWNLEELANHGTNPKLRWKILRERVLAMKEIWTQDEAEFHGEFVNFDAIWQWPKPIQKPHPPILVGGSGPRTLDRVIEYGDGWMPVVDRPGALQIILDYMEQLRHRAAEAGRGPIPVTIFGTRPTARAIERFQAAGASGVVFLLPPLDYAGAKDQVAQCAELMKSFA